MPRWSATSSCTGRSRAIPVQPSLDEVDELTEVRRAVAPAVRVHPPGDEDIGKDLHDQAGLREAYEPVGLIGVLDVRPDRANRVEDRAPRHEGIEDVAEPLPPRRAVARLLVFEPGFP